MTNYALRQPLKAPGFAIAAVLTLALGIGANTAMFTAIDSVLLRPLPYKDSGRLISIGEGRQSGEIGATSWLNLLDLSRHSKTLAEAGGYVGDVAILQGKQSGETVLGAKLTCNVLRLLDAAPLMGRGFTDADCSDGASPTVLLSENVWRQDFAADPNIVGRQVLIGDLPHTVIGVMPARFAFPEEEGADAAKGVWLPSILTGEMKHRGFTPYSGIARLQPGVTPGQAQAELSTIAADISKSDPDDAANLHFSLRPYRQNVTGDIRPVFLALAAALALVLLIACVNVANLQLSRCLARHHELAVRSALGASKWRLVRELLVESSLLSFLGAFAGLGLAWGILQLLKLLPADMIPRADEIHLRWEVMGALIGFATLATLLSAVIPALFAMRTEPQAVLRGAGRGVSQKAGRTRMAAGLVLSEVAIAAILLVGCSLLFHTLYNLEHRALGFQVADITTFAATPPTSSGYLGNYSKSPQNIGIATRLYLPILERLRALPGVEQAALASSIPFDGVDIETSFTFKNEPPKTLAERKENHAFVRVMSGGYLQAMATPLLRGRPIADSDTENRRFVAVVNQQFVRQYLPNRDPIGRQLDMGGKDTGMVQPYTIVGVMADAVQKSNPRQPKPEIVFSYRQIPPASLFYPLFLTSATSYIIRTRTRFDISREVRSVFHQMAPGFAIDNLQTMRKTVDSANFNQRLGVYLIGSFAALAVLMVVVGLYGVLSQLVSQRRREIGVRVALGASRASILSMIFRQGSIFIGAGLLVGLALAFAASRTVASFLYQVKPTDLPSYLAAAFLLLVIGLGAALLPARRAASISPAEALRSE